MKRKTKEAVGTPFPWQQGDYEDYNPRVVFHAPTDENELYVPVCQCERAEDAAKIVAMTQSDTSKSRRLDMTLTIQFPLNGSSKSVRVIVDLQKQVIRFKEPGKRWKSIAIWLVAESAGIDP